MRWPASSTALVVTVSRPWPTSRISRLRRSSRFRSMKTTSTSARARPPSDSTKGLSKAGNRDSQAGLSGWITTCSRLRRGGLPDPDRLVRRPSFGPAGCRLPLPANVLDHLLQAFRGRPLAHLPQRSDLPLDVLGVRREVAARLVTSAVTSQTDAAQDQRRQQHDQDHRGRSPQVPPLEDG